MMTQRMDEPASEAAPETAFDDLAKLRNPKAAAPVGTDQPAANDASTGKKPAKARKSKKPVKVGSDEYECCADGVYLLETKRNQDGAEEDARRVICGPLQPVACLAADDGAGWALLVRLVDRMGREKELQLPFTKIVAGNSPAIVEALADSGLFIPSAPDNFRKVCAYLNASAQGLPFMTKTTRTGWCSGPAYVLPDVVLGKPETPLLYVGAERSKLAQAGTLEGWKEGIAAYAVGNPLLIVSLCAAFCGPLMSIVGQSTAGFHVKGASSQGKSTMLNAACSVYGRPADYRRTWNSTEVGAENLLSAHSDLFLALDELHQCKPHDADRVVYLLSQSQGRNRGRDVGGNRALQTWSCCLFSTGEVGLSEHLRKANIDVQAGQQVRLIELRTERQHGAFDELHGLPDGKTLADTLQANWRQHHGTAGMEYLRLLAEETDHAQLREQYRQVAQAFVKARVPQAQKVDGQVSRVADYFALLAFAGELATSYGLTGWPQNTAYDAAGWAFDEWLQSRGTMGSLEDQKVLRQVRRWFENNQHRFEELPIREHAGRVIQPAGYVEYHEPHLDGRFDGQKVKVPSFYVYRNTWREEVLAGLDERKAHRVLIAHGILKPGDGRNVTTQKRLKTEGNKERYYLVTAEVFGGEDE